MASSVSVLRRHAPSTSERKLRDASAKRLLRDFAELQMLQSSGELSTIVAQPLENNMYEWHVNLLAPEGCRFHGIVCHLKMVFPHNYPNSPPTVSCISKLQHSHVFDNYICLDMLEDSGKNNSSGWSTGYSAASILLQLQSFLLSDEQLHDYRRISMEQTQWDIKNSHKTTCNCGHDPQNNKPWPWNTLWQSYRNPSTASAYSSSIPESMVSIQPREQVGKQSQPSLLMTLSDDVLLLMCLFLPDVTLTTKLSRVSQRFAQICKHPFLRERRELVCFHTRAPFEETILGIGFTFNFHRRDPTSIENITACLDLLSWEAFNELNVRWGLWNDSFDQFLPLYINAQHAKRSMPLLEQTLLHRMYAGVNLSSSGQQQQRDVATLAVDLLSKLLNSTIVQVMNFNLHASLRALDGFVTFHRIFIHMCKKYPNILIDIDKKIENFIKYEKNRHKSSTANLGEFLAQFLVSERYSWDDIKTVLLQEVFDRNALWISNKYPELAVVKQGKESVGDRISKSFEATQVSNRLISFIYFFAEHIVGKGKSDCPSLDDIAADYDSRFGRASDEMRQALQSAIQTDIIGISSLREYLYYVNSPIQSNQEIYIMLCKAMENAQRRGYMKRPAEQPTHHQSHQPHINRPKYDRYDRNDRDGSHWQHGRRY